MRYVLFAIRAYWVVLFVWAIGRLFGLLAGAFGSALNIAAYPIWRPLEFLPFGYMLGPMFTVLFLWLADQWVLNRIEKGAKAKESSNMQELVAD